MGYTPGFLAWQDGLAWDRDPCCCTSYRDSIVFMCVILLRSGLFLVCILVRVACSQDAAADTFLLCANFRAVCS